MAEAPWQTSATQLELAEPATANAGRPDLPEGVEDGSWVEGRLLGWSGRVPDGEDQPLLPEARTVQGPLNVQFVEVLDSWRLSVNGQSVEAASLRLVAPPEDVEL